MHDEQMLEKLRYIVNHVFMPAKLPQEDVQSNKEYDKDFALCYVACLEQFVAQFPENNKGHSGNWIKMVQSFRDLNGPKPFEPDGLLRQLRGMQDGDVVPVFVRAQNAGVIFRFHQDDVFVETFEASPRNQDVLSCTGNLICEYPGPTISIPANTFMKDSVQQEISVFLSHMNVDELEGSVAHSVKAGSQIKELRESAHPRYVTDLFVGILESMGKNVTQTVPKFTKRIRDDVLWRDTLLPWRRSPVWLVLRVALQSTMLASGNNTIYKNFLAYMMADNLQMATAMGLESELLYGMRTKVTKRAAKLDGCLFDFVGNKVVIAADEVEGELQGRWQAIQEDFRTRLTCTDWAPHTLDLSNHTILSLPHATSYLVRTQANLREANNQDAPFVPPNDFRPFKSVSNLFDLRTTRLLTQDVTTNLADFEAFVTQYSDSWSQEPLAESILACMEQYFSAAASTYKGDPDSQSLMLLTLCELWIALDKAATDSLPLLKHHPPELSSSAILSPLLIRRTQDVKRVKTIAGYIAARESAATEPSVFAETTASSFSVQYFMRSRHLQELKQSIENHGTLSRRQKQDELHQKNERHRIISGELTTLVHDDTCSNGQKPTESCRRCTLSLELSALTIAVHEWPLPEKEILAKAAVFEGDCPPVFSIWREATYFMLHDVLTNEDDYEHRGPTRRAYTRIHVHLSRVDPATNARDMIMPRITVASNTKGFSKSHYRMVSVPSVESNICVPHAHNWTLYDRKHKAWITGTPATNASTRCSYTLPERSLYDGLSYALHTEHTENDAIASHISASRDLSPNEYVAFASLRAGGRAQWLNIARALAAESFTLNSNEVYTLFAQSALQVGDLTANNELEWHEELKSSEFCGVILQTMSTIYDQVQGNWMEIATLRLIILLTIRILVVTVEWRTRALQLLQKVRLKVYQWLIATIDYLEVNGTGYETVSTRLRICELASTCRLTFDLDSDLFRDVLKQPGNVTMLLRCQMAVADYEVKGDESNPTLKALLCRSWRIALDGEQDLFDMICKEQGGIDGALEQVWGSYERCTSWTRMETPHQQWLVCTTMSSATRESQVAHVNVLTGSLLVDGRAIGHLPRDITQHPTFMSIFGQRNFTVIPSRYHEMQYETRKSIAGYQLFFSKASDRVIIRARGTVSTETPMMYELLPASIFSGDIPQHFVEENTFWMKMPEDTRTSLGDLWIELRPRTLMWQSVPATNWCFYAGGSTPWTKARLCLGKRSIIDRHSIAFAMVYNRLRSFEQRDFVVVTHHPGYFQFAGTHKSALALHVELPRFKLSFFLDDNNQLRSQNLSQCIVDLDQTIGTMTGLENRLVLSETLRQVDLPRRRRILIPIGKVNCHLTKSHVEVRIDHHEAQDSKRLLYHDYLIDTELGALIGNSTMESHLYKIYLHALTSHSLPDPLTQRTGVRTALDELNSVASLSFRTLSPPAAELLHQLRSLTPVRSYYPPHRKSMYTIDWSLHLPLVAQNTGFEPRVCEIFSYAHDLQLFNARPQHHLNRSGAETTSQEFAIQGEDISPRSPPKLLHRARDLRTIPQPHSSNYDCVYISSSLDARAESRHRQVSQAIFQRDITVFKSDRLFHGMQETLREWRELRIPLAPSLSLTYSREWLEPAKILGKSSWLLLCWLSYGTRGEDGSRNREVHNPLGLLFCLSSLAFEDLSTAEISIVAYLIAISILPQFTGSEECFTCEYDLQYGTTPNRQELERIIAKHLLPGFDGKVQVGTLQKSVEALITQWPSSLQIPVALRNVVRSEAELTREILEAFEHWRRNDKLMSLIRIAQDAYRYAHVQTSVRDVSEQPPTPRTSTRETQSLLNVSRSRMNTSYSIVDVMNLRSAPDHINSRSSSSKTLDLSESRAPGIATDAKSMRELSWLATALMLSPHPLRQAYGIDVQKSMDAFSVDRQTKPVEGISGHNIFVAGRQRKEVVRRQNDLVSIVGSISSVLVPRTVAEKMLAKGGNWPAVTLRALLNVMSRSGGWSTLQHSWKVTLVELGLALLRYQHARRLLILVLRNREEELLEASKDANTMSADDAIHHPEWLLIQASTTIENDFLARPVQIQVAKEMFAPSSGGNTVLQLNMGEGKSSVILPMVASSLANGHNLVRVVVLKSLSQEMFQLMVQRMSGLLNRRVCYFPFTRQTQLGQSELGQLFRLYQGCVNDGGILVVQPEHILSSKLLLVDQVISEGISNRQKALSRSLELQEWLTHRARDILDESDELLHVRYQLIYTVGRQMPIEGQPYRWQTAQTVLALVDKHVDAWREQYTEGYVVQLQRASPWAYPSMRFYFDKDSDMPSALLDSVVREIVDDNAIHGLVTTHLNDSERQLLAEFILSPSDSSDGTAHGRESLRRLLNEGHMWNIVLILRGLLGSRLLLHVLCEKRWRVDYGLDLTRSLLAVPYRAKDVPSARAEYGHPDMAILVTCLAYYYHGLTAEQVSSCFRRLFRRRNASTIYSSWTELIPRSDLPLSIRSIRGVNVEDKEQHAMIIHPLFRYNRAVINFYLAEVVFPSASKEFPHKLPSSGWDLAEIRDHTTTGFSGTNDNHFLLPSTISQEDPVAQRGTNALVLSNLLGPENGPYVLCTGDSPGQPMTGKRLIELVTRQSPPIRVLLDVGAQMLDMQNLEVVRYWLHLNSRYASIEAAIFFNADDELTVLSRDGSIEAFVSSSYRQSIGNCIVYLDDAHTRGTDVKLPRNSRAAVTLGPKVTKDRLVQGCMRMRQLGHGQSVMFFAPPETDALIRKSRDNSEARAAIKVVDIIRWTMNETVAELLHHAPHWAQQGLDYMARKEAMSNLPSDPSAADIALLKRTWLQKEARTLEELYDNKPDSQTLHTSAQSFPEIAERLHLLGFNETLQVNTDEEQEREVSHEIQIEVDHERPRNPKPCSPTLHRDVEGLVTSGIVKTDSDAFVNAWATLRDVRYQKAHRSSDLFKSKLLVTNTFAETVVGGYNVEYLKPVQWILSLLNEPFRSQDFLIILSQFEVTQLLPQIRSSPHVRLHMYSAKTSISSQAFDDLCFYCIPPILAGVNSQEATNISSSAIAELNMFAGQLYPSSYREYTLLCDFLGLDSTPRSDRMRDRFVGKSSKLETPFKSNPTRFFKELFAIRRKGQEIDSTPVGRMLNGRRLLQSDFQT